MIGGFLGAGKTTAMLQLARHLQRRGQRAGLITNDQAADLADSARATSAGFPVEEIAGGCFCCRFDSLVTAAQRLTAATAPDVLIAEPVGSCTDLKATVSYPLRRLYGRNCVISPLSVLVDPARCNQALSLDSTAGFSEKVRYIYRKQLEEAEILVVNKIDLRAASDRQRLRAALRREFPQTKIIEVSCLTGENLPAWFDQILNGALGRRDSIEVDYDVYAEGEALLGWLNAMASVQAPRSFDGNQFLSDLTVQLRDRLARAGIQIAHLKLTLSPRERADLGAISLTETEGKPQATHLLHEKISHGVLTINLRAEADPEEIRREAVGALKQTSTVKAELMRVNAFRPGRPNPTHRMAAASI